jgi:hypothetical protein
VRGGLSGPLLFLGLVGEESKSNPTAKSRIKIKSKIKFKSKSPDLLSGDRWGRPSTSLRTGLSLHDRSVVYFFFDIFGERERKTWLKSRLRTGFM